MAELAPVKQGRITTPTVTKDLIQQYRSTMNNVLQNLFPTLNGAGPDLLFIMMATMGCESTFRLTFGNPPTPNHPGVPPGQWFYRKFFGSPNIVAIMRGNPTGQTYRNLLEGVSAKSLMGTMGAYNIRGNVHYNSEIASNPRYVAILNENSMIVEAGESVSAIYTGDVAPTRAMIMGCMIMESKYNAAKYGIGNAVRSNTDALYVALQSYVGSANAVGFYGESGAGRLAAINDPNNSTVRKLNALGIAKGNGNAQMVAVNGQPSQNAQITSNNGTSATTNNESVNVTGCRQA